MSDDAHQNWSLAAVMIVAILAISGCQAFGYASKACPASSTIPAQGAAQ